MHWTYEDVAAVNRASLCQGDVIERTEELDKLLAEVHPYFVKPKYLYFVVITQSCDLVRRVGPCKAEYVTLAVVRSIDDVLDRELERITRPRSSARADLVSLCDGEFVSEEVRSQFEQTVERVLNNTHDWYFYLRADRDAGLPTDCCAFLRVSFAMQAQHYELLCRAKVAQLRPVFQARLGDIVGTLYSRVATEDWSDDEPRRAEFKELRRRLLDSVRWVPRARFREAVKLLEKEGLPETTESVQRVLERPEVRAKERRESVLAALEESWPPDIDAATKQRIRTNLENKPGFAWGVRE